MPMRVPHCWSRPSHGWTMGMVMGIRRSSIVAQSVSANQDATYSMGANRSLARRPCIRLVWLLAHSEERHAARVTNQRDQQFKQSNVCRMGKRPRAGRKPIAVMNIAARSAKAIALKSAPSGPGNQRENLSKPQRNQNSCHARRN